MKVMSVTTANALNYNQKTNEQRPSFKSLMVTLKPTEECSRQGLVGFAAIVKYVENNIGEGTVSISTRLGMLGEKIVGIINTKNTPLLEEAVNNCFFNGKATAISDEAAELIPPGLAQNMDIPPFPSDVLADAEKLAKILNPTEEELKQLSKAKAKAL